MQNFGFVVDTTFGSSSYTSDGSILSVGDSLNFFAACAAFVLIAADARP